MTIAHSSRKVLARPANWVASTQQKNHHQSILLSPSTTNFDRESLAIGGQD
jgi:hypothetical protein